MDGFMQQAGVNLLETPDLLTAGFHDLKFCGCRFMPEGEYIDPKTQENKAIKARIMWYFIYVDGPITSLKGTRIKLRSGTSSGDKSNLMPLFIGVSGFHSPTDVEFYGWKPVHSIGNVAKFETKEEKMQGVPFTKIEKGVFLRHEEPNDTSDEDPFATSSGKNLAA